MPKHSVPRNQLYQMEQDIIKMQNEQPTIAFLMQHIIKNFYAKNKMQIHIMHTRFDAIRDTYIQKDEKGNWLTTGDGEDLKWKFITSLPDLQQARILDVSQVEEKFTQASKDFFQQLITIEW